MTLMKQSAPRKKIIVGAIWMTTMFVLIAAWFCRVTVEPGHELVFNAKPLILLWSGGLNSTPLSLIHI